MSYKSVTHVAATFIDGPLDKMIKVVRRDGSGRPIASITIPAACHTGFGEVVYRLYDTWPVKYMLQKASEVESTE